MPSHLSRTSFVYHVSHVVIQTLGTIDHVPLKTAAIAIRLSSPHCTGTLREVADVGKHLVASCSQIFPGYMQFLHLK